MKRRSRRVWVALTALACLLAAASLEAKSSKPTKPAPDAKEPSADEFETKTKVPLVGEFTQILGQNWIMLHGVGLVTGLNGTGEDPPPSTYRTAVLEDMKRRGVRNPNELLRSSDTAIVMIKAYMPPLIRKSDHFDVEVSLPPGSKVKSLSGGWLMETYLSEQAGHEYATAKGPILVTAVGDRDRDLAGVLRRGRVVGGGVSRTDRNLEIHLRNDFRSVRNSERISRTIGNRFFEHDRHGQQIPMAVAKTDQRIELRVPSKYRDNYPRFLDVIRRIAFNETEVSRHVRMRSLNRELLNADSCASAALTLEAIGDKSVPILKSGLASKSVEVRFHSAVALAYLGDSSGLEVLAGAARDEYAFRIYALAGMAALEDPEVHVKLRELMDSESAEARYGAFRALTTLDSNDPFVRGKKIDNQFTLHVLATNGPPMVHLTNWKKTEVVLFGSDQRIRTPIAARAGTRILVTAQAGSDQVTVSRFEPRRPDQRKVVSSRLQDVIMAATELGATFPDVAQFLAEANAQSNLAGRLEIDALPRAGRLYQRAEAAKGAKSGKRRVGDAHMAPNLFSADQDGKAGGTPEQDESTDEASRGQRDSHIVQAGAVSEPASPAAARDAKPAAGAPANLPSVGAPSVGPGTTSARTTGSGATGVGTTGKSKGESAPSKAVRSDRDGDLQTSGVKHAVHAEPAPKSKHADVAVDELDEAPPPAQSSGRFRWLRFFGLGAGAPSGNREP